MIRSATRQDAAAIAAIWNHYIRTSTVTFLPDEKSEAEVAAMIGGDDPCFVFEDAGAILGFARYFPFRSGRGYIHTVEHTVLLAPDTTRLFRRGIGRALVSHLIADAGRAGKHSMWAGVSAENTAGVAFHAVMGFQKIAVLPEVGYKFGRWIDLVLMQKRI